MSQKRKVADILTASEFRHFKRLRDANFETYDTDITFDTKVDAGHKVAKLIEKSLNEKITENKEDLQFIKKIAKEIEE